MEINSDRNNFDFFFFPDIRVPGSDRSHDADGQNQGRAILERQFREAAGVCVCAICNNEMYLQQLLQQMVL